MDYDLYNREERYYCAHLFRLLHKWISHKDHYEKLVKFLKASGAGIGKECPSSIRVYCEAALIRDAYFVRKRNVDDLTDWMDRLTRQIAEQETKASDSFRVYSRLPEILRDPKRTHPTRILWRARKEGIGLSEDERVVYRKLREMFNAKPDLAVIIDRQLIVYEAKLTQKFSPAQLKRTRKIAEVWSKLLYRDLGFQKPPEVITATIGPRKWHPEICWEELSLMARQTYKINDRTCVVLENAVSLAGR
jgi:hypothetical protein